MECAIFIWNISLSKCNFSDFTILYPSKWFCFYHVCLLAFAQWLSKDDVAYSTDLTCLCVFWRCKKVILYGISVQSAASWFASISTSDVWKWKNSVWSINHKLQCTGRMEMERHSTLLLASTGNTFRANSLLAWEAGRWFFAVCAELPGWFRVQGCR